MNNVDTNTMQIWESLIQKAKYGGLDAIDTYVFWNLHEIFWVMKNLLFS